LATRPVLKISDRYFVNSIKGKNLKLFPLWLVSAVFVSVQAIAILLAFYMNSTALNSEQLRFEASVARKIDTIKSGVETYLGLLRGLAAYVSVSQDYQIQDLNSFGALLDIRENYPGIQGIGLTVRIDPEEKVELESWMQQQGWSGFSVWPEHIRDEYHSIIFLYPPDERNLAAIGYDMHSEPVRQEAMATARDTGMPAASGVVTLVQEITEEKQPGFLIYVPIFEGKFIPTTNVEQRRERLLAFSYSPFRANDFFNSMFLLSETAEEIDFIVFDGDSMQPEQILHDSRVFNLPLPDGYYPKHRQILSMEVAGREWSLLLLSRPAFHELAPYNPFWWIVFSGSILGLFSSAFAGMRIRNQRRVLEESRKVFEQKERLRVTLASIGDAVIATDKSGKVIFLNKIAEDLTGCLTSQATGQHLDEIFRVFERESSKRISFEASRSAKSQPIADEAYLVTKSGAQLSIDFSFAPILSEQRNIEGVVIVFQDVTSKRKRALIDSIEYQAAKELANPGDFNQSMCSLMEIICSRLNWNVGAFWMPGESLYELKCFVVRGEDAKTYDSLKQPLAIQLGRNNLSGTPFFEQTLPIWKIKNLKLGDEKNGTATHMNTVIAFPVVSRGENLGLIEFACKEKREKDHYLINSLISIGRQVGQIIEQKKWEQALLESESRFRRLANVAPILIRTSEQNKLCTWFNQSWLEFTGRSIEQELGNGWMEGIYPDDKERVKNLCLEAFADQGVRKMEYRLRRHDGLHRWIIDHGIPLYGPEGKFSGYIWSSTDVTDLKEKEEERKNRLARETELRREAEMANRVKDEFLATLSHELRTPLNAVQGWAQLIRRKPDDPGHLKKGLDIIERNARLQGQIIEDLLDMNRIMSGRIRLNLETLALEEVLSESIETIRPAADAKGLSISKKFSPAKILVQADRQRLHQILWNLLSNSVKFTPTGGKIHVEANATSKGFEIIVSDSGEGIKPDFVQNIFDRFSQADASPSRRHGGLGLGLAIVKHLVEIHGGTISAKSAGLNKGSSFTVSLPLLKVQADSNGSELNPEGCLSCDELEEDDLKLEGVSVLVVDDQLDARELVAEILSKSGAKVVTASSADEAVEIVAQIRPNVIVSDIAMPIKDGYELLRMVRALPPEKGGKVPALALTAFARAEDRSSVLEHGYEMHLSKPTEPDALKKAVALLAITRAPA